MNSTTDHIPLEDGHVCSECMLAMDIEAEHQEAKANKNTENVDITRPKVNLLDIASPNMTPEAEQVVSEALERSAEVMNRVTTERDIDELLIEFEQNCMRIREAPIDGEILAVSITHQQDLAKQAIESHYKAKFEKLIGEDEPVKARPDKVKQSAPWQRNQLRANLREKLK